MKIIIDTNFLILPGRYKIDIFEELRKKFGRLDIYTTIQIIKELEKISKGFGKTAANAKIGLELVKKTKIKRIKEKNADRAILSLAPKGYIVCTQDKELIRKLKKKSVVCVYFSPTKRKLMVY